MTGLPPGRGPVDPAEARRLRREVMRAHHPDLGGDAEAFIEALRRFEEATTSEPPLEVRFARRRRRWVIQARISFRRQQSQRVR